MSNIYITPIEYIITLTKNMAKENISQEFRMKNKDKAGNCFLQEINENDLMSKKHKKVYSVLNYIERLLILASALLNVFQFLLLLL